MEKCRFWGFKFSLEEHHGIGWLCDYRMERRPDAAKVTNPTRIKSRNTLRNAELAVAELERHIGRNVITPATDINEENHTLAGLTRQLEVARATSDAARVGLKAIPAKIPATDIDPNATRAWPTSKRAKELDESISMFVNYAEYVVMPSRR